MNAKPLDLGSIDRAARDAYAQDRATEAGLCITCDRPKADDRRECWPCWGKRRARGAR